MKKLLILFLVIVLGGCQDIENCDTNDEQAFMVVEFLDKESATPKKVGFLIGTGSTAYSGIYSSDSTLAGLPLNPNTSETSYFFLTDTSNFELTISYETQVSIFDEGCDPSVLFMNLDTISYSFDSLSIPGTFTNRLIGTNVQVFL